MVAPLAGAWIEIMQGILLRQETLVAPLAGAWIEMRGVLDGIVDKIVAPLAGAWIEIVNCRLNIVRAVRRSPCGSVD